jgi:hypothetical protein
LRAGNNGPVGYLAKRSQVERSGLVFADQWRDLYTGSDDLLNLIRRSVRRLEWFFCLRRDHTDLLHMYLSVDGLDEFDGDHNGQNIETFAVFDRLTDTSISSFF